MKISSELLGLGLLTIATVAWVKGPMASRWSSLQSLQRQFQSQDREPNQAHLEYELGLLQARISHAQKRLDQLQPPLSNQPLSLVDTLQARCKQHGCELLSWTEIATNSWQAELTGSTLELTQILHDLEMAMPTLATHQIELHYQNNRLGLRLQVAFPEDQATPFDAIPKDPAGDHP